MSQEPDVRGDWARMLGMDDAGLNDDMTADPKIYVVAIATATATVSAVVVDADAGPDTRIEKDRKPMMLL